MGDPTSPKANIEMTCEVHEAAERLGITLHDHVIISKSGHNSFKSLGLLSTGRPLPAFRAAGAPLGGR